MNGYLVMLIHTMDDLPLALFKTHAEAINFAASVEQMPTETIRNIYGTDCSTPIKVEVIRFVSGLPVDISVVKDFTE